MAIIDASSEDEELIRKYLIRKIKDRRVQKVALRVLIVLLLLLSGYFIWNLIPRHYCLKITGGNILGTRHFIAKMLSAETERYNVSLEIHPTKGSVEALEEVNRGSLDLAFIQGGLEEQHFDNVRHVATIIPEVLHLLVRGNINSIADLRGKTVNLGSKKGGTRVIVEKVLEFSELTPVVDYVVKNYNVEELNGMSPVRLPDAVFLLSTPPSYAVEQLVRNSGYHLLEIPFPPALALRYGWVADEKILAYTYQVKPAEPAKDIKSIGVNMHLVANANVPEEAVFRVLEGLYDKHLEDILLIPLTEEKITVPSGFPISNGTVAYLNRDDPILSMQNLDRLIKWFGMVFSFITTLVVLYRWFTENDEEPETADKEFKDYLEQVASLETELKELLRKGFSTEELVAVEEALTALRISVLSTYKDVHLKDAFLLEKVLSGIDGSRAYITQLNLRFPEGKP